MLPIQKFGPLDRCVKVSEAAKITGLSVSEIDRRVKAGEDFPKPLQLGAKRKGYMLSDCQAWLAAKAGAAVSA